MQAIIRPWILLRCLQFYDNFNASRGLCSYTSLPFESHTALRPVAAPKTLNQTLWTLASLWMCRTLYTCSSVNRRLKNSWRRYPQRKLNSENKVGWVREEYQSSGWNYSHPSSLFPSFYPPPVISCICNSKVEVTTNGRERLIKIHWIEHRIITSTNYKKVKTTVCYAFWVVTHVLKFASL